MDHTPRARREFRDVRHPLKPELRVERVIICHSGVHVVTSIPAGDYVPVAAGHAAADVVSSLLPQRYRDRVRPVLCRPKDDEPMADLVDDVLVTTPDTLEHIVRSSPPVLSTSEIHEISLRLDAGLEPYPAVAEVRRTRWTRRRGLVAVAVAATAAAGGVLLDGLGALPW
jgi:hypothetical protein